MNIAQWLEVFKARWKVAALVFVLVCVGSGIYFARQPKQYTAYAQLLIAAQPDPVSTLFYGGMASPGQVNNEIEVLRSERVSLKVVKDLKLGEDPKLRATWMAVTQGRVAIDNWLAAFIVKGLQAYTTQVGGNVVTVAYQAATAERAARMANGFVRAYLNTAVELRVDPAREYNTFFAEQVKEARETLERSQQALSDFERKNGIISTKGADDLDITRLEKLADDLSAAAGARAGSRVSSQSAEVQTSSAVAGLRAELATAERKLSELSGRFGANHPQVKDARAAVSDLKVRLERESRLASGSLSSRANAGAGREAALRAEYDAQRNKVLKLKEVRDAGQVLVREVENAQKSYDMVRNKYNQTALESQNRKNNATIMTEATPPANPSSARLRSNLMVGGMLALAAAIAAVFVWEKFDRRVRLPVDVIELGLPIIGSVPARSLGKASQRKLAHSKKIVISGRPAAPEGGAG